MQGVADHSTPVLKVAVGELLIELLDPFQKPLLSLRHWVQITVFVAWHSCASRSIFREPSIIQRPLRVCRRAEENCSSLQRLKFFTTKPMNTNLIKRTTRVRCELCVLKWIRR